METELENAENVRNLIPYEGTANIHHGKDGDRPWYLKVLAIGQLLLLNRRRHRGIVSEGMNYARSLC